MSAEMHQLLELGADVFVRWGASVMTIRLVCFLRPSTALIKALVIVDIHAAVLRHLR